MPFPETKGFHKGGVLIENGTPIIGKRSLKKNGGGFFCHFQKHCKICAIAPIVVRRKVLSWLQLNLRQLR